VQPLNIKYLPFWDVVTPSLCVMIFQVLIDTSVFASAHPLLIPCQWFGAMFAWL
jgi:hypothetical protein